MVEFRVTDGGETTAERSRKVLLSVVSGGALLTEASDSGALLPVVSADSWSCCLLVAALETAGSACAC